MHGWRARLGLMIPSTDVMQETVYHQIVPNGVSVHFTRLTLEEVTLEALKKMAMEIENAAKLLSMARVDVIGYGCTSGTIAIGDKEVMKRIKGVAPNIQATTMATAVINALRALKIGKVALATAYIDEITEKEVSFLEEHGFRVISINGLGIKVDYEISQVSVEEIYRLAKGVNVSGAEGIFISCGALRSHEIVELLEKDIGKPVVVSNQAMIWDMLRRAGVGDVIRGYGKLLGFYKNEER